METISLVGGLVNLEIFICSNCYQLRELPAEMKRLNRLKLLDLSYCSRLESIGRDIISSLVMLEELKMLRSFNKWEGDDGVGENAGVTELEKLTNLRCLEIEIANPALTAIKMRIPSTLERFKVIIPSIDVSLDDYYNKYLVLEWEECICIGDWIEMQLLRDTECLYLIGNGANKLYSKTLENIRRLELSDIGSVTNIALLCPLIEHLHISSLDKQEEIWDAPISLFTNLSYIKIEHCPRLLNVGQLSIAGSSDCLPRLETLKISDCEMMEQVFLCSEEGDQQKNIKGAPDRLNSKLLFPKLKKLKLSDLPNLTTLCRGIEGIAFPLLEKISYSECPKLRSIISTTSLDENERGADNGDIDDHQSTASEQVSFGSLKHLWSDQNLFWGYEIHVSSFNELEAISIIGYRGSKSLFTSSVAENLASLRELCIANCEEMSRVIEDGKEGNDKAVNLLLPVFPKLEQLALMDLPKLVSFWEWKGDVEWPSLREVVIRKCPNMRNITLGPLTTPNLAMLEIEYRYYPNATKDLNGMLQQSTNYSVAGNTSSGGGGGGTQQGGPCSV